MNLIIKIVFIIAVLICLIEIVMGFIACQKQIHKEYQHNLKELQRKGLVMPSYEENALRQHLKTLPDNEFLIWYSKWYQTLNTVCLPNGKAIPLTDYLFNKYTK